MNVISSIVHIITDLSGWGSRTSSPTPTMDNVVVWASHADGGLWSIGGYGALGATQRYDSGSGTWSAHNTQCYDPGPLPEPRWGMTDGWQIYR